MTLHKLTIELSDHEFERLRHIKRKWDEEEGYDDDDNREDNDGFDIGYVASIIVANYVQKEKEKEIENI